MQDVGSCPESLVARGQARLFGVAGSSLPGSVSSMLSGSNVKGSCPESLVARGQARLFRVAGLNLPGSVGTSLSDRSVSYLNPCLCCYHPLRIIF